MWDLIEPLGLIALRTTDPFIPARAFSSPRELFSRKCFNQVATPEAA
jgi:hypothetical protein